MKKKNDTDFGNDPKCRKVQHMSPAKLIPTKQLNGNRYFAAAFDANDCVLLIVVSGLECGHIVVIVNRM